MSATEPAAPVIAGLGAGERAPPCPHVARGCGGCDWQHLEPGTQRSRKVELVDRELGPMLGGSGPPIELRPLADEAYRTTVRLLAGSDGRPAFRRRRRHEPVAVDSCLIAHPLIAQLLVEGDFGPVGRDITLRASVATGERIVVASPIANGIRMPDDVIVVGDDELRAGRRVWFQEEAGGRSWRVSAQSFFQARPDGASVLVELVGDALDEIDGPMLDACAGVGLFGGTVGSERRTIAVERSPSAVADARVNLGPSAKVLRMPIARWRRSPVAVAVADPPRSGLGPAGVRAVVAARPQRVVLVSCDLGAAARDLARFSDGGYTLKRVTVVDLFPQTSHLELVSVMDRHV